RVLFKRESGTGRFAGVALIDGGQVIESPEEAGINHFIARLCLLGTRCASLEEMVQKMADLGMEVYSSRAGDHADFSLSCAAGVRRDALEIFCEILGKPSFPSHEVERIRSETVTEIASLKDDSFALTGLEFKKILYGAHPYGRSIIGETE